MLITTAGYHTLCTISTNDPRPDWDVSVRLILVQFESGSFSSENKRRISKIPVAPNHSVRGYFQLQYRLLEWQKNPVEPKDVVKNWTRSKNTIEYLGLWEMLNNPDFKGVEFDPFLKEAGSHSFTMSPSRWIEVDYDPKGVDFFATKVNTPE